MLRKLLVILTMLLGSMATQVYALGLGSLSVESSLNQPLQARIELIQLAGTALEDISVRMAPPDDFQRFDIERVGFLSNIRISLQATSTGNEVVLSSSQVVGEPYLSFVLETRWPGGRLLSEHTILLDLPVFDDQQAAAAVRQPISPILQAPEPDRRAAAATVAASSAPAVNPARSAGQINSGADLQPEIIAVTPPEEETPEPEAAVDDTVEIEETLVAATPLEETPAATAEAIVEEEQDSPAVQLTAEPEPQPQVEEVEVAVEPEPQVEEVVAPADNAIAAEAESQAPESIETTSADTLSAIAMRTRPDSSVSMQQTMLAIQQLNPDAFAGGNINRMLSGQVLRMPSLTEIQAIDAREAMTEVASQSQQFGSTDIQPLAAPASASPVQDDVQQGRLSVVNNDDDGIDADGPANAGFAEEETAELDRRIAELESQLLARREEAERARLEREELELRLQSLESQIAATQEIIRLQDIRLAQLQDSLAQAAEIAEQEAALAAAQAEAALPVAPPVNRTLLDDLLRILGGNNLFMIFAVALVILLLVLLLLRRSSAAKLNEEEIDEIAEQAFDGSTTSKLDDEKTVVEESVVEESEYQDYDASDLDNELNEIIGIDDESEDDKDTQGPEADDLDIEDFEVASSSGEAASKQESEIDSMLDDMGIDSFDDIDEKVSAYSVPDEESESLEDDELEEIDILTPQEPVVEEVELLESEELEIEEVEILEPEELEAEEIEIIEPETAEIEEVEIIEPDEPEVAETSIADDLAPAADIISESDSATEEVQHFDFNEEGVSGETIESAADTGEDLEIDTLEFEADSSAEANQAPQPATEEELDLETFSFVADEQPGVEEEAEDSSDAEPVDDPEAVDFDFDASDLGEEVASEAVETDEELETFDFDETSNDAATGQPEEIATSVEQESDDFDLGEVEIADEASVEESLEVEEELPTVELELADDDDDLEFLSDDFEIDLGPVSDVEEIDLLPNYDESESATKLELAYAYQKMGDPEGAKEILREVISEGSEEQITEAKGLLDSLDRSAK